MGRRIHFISGLPRSGSTLLGAILKQNPGFHAGMTSPIGALLTTTINHLSAGSEFGPLVDQSTRQRILQGLFASYYADIPADAVIFDTNRLWTSKLPVLSDLFPGAKTICCVRSISWILDSFERIYRSSIYDNTRLFHSEAERNTVYSRTETLAQRDRVVGLAWSALKEAYYSEHASSILLVEYDDLVKYPDKVIRLIYNFIGEEPFVHNFSNILFESKEFDAALGTPNLHAVRTKVSQQCRRSILPPDIYAKYLSLSFWQTDQASSASVIRIDPASSG